MIRLISATIVLAALVMLPVQAIIVASIAGDVGHVFLVGMLLAMLSPGLVICVSLPLTLRGGLMMGAFAELSDTYGFLARSLRQGMPLRAALEAAAHDSSSWRVRSALRKVSRRVQKGEPLSAALGAAWLVFRRPDRVVVQSGEESGDVAGALELLSATAMLRRTTHLPQALFGLQVVGILILSFWLLLVQMSTFKEILDQLGGQLPGITQAMIEVNRLLTLYTFWFVIAGVLTYLIIGRERIEYLLVLFLPYLRHSLWDVRFARMAYVWNSCGRGTSPECMTRVLDAAGHIRGFYRRRILKAAAAGEPLGPALLNDPGLPRSYVVLLASQTSAYAFLEQPETASQVGLRHRGLLLALAIVGPLTFDVIAVIAIYLPLFNIPNVVGQG